MDEDERRARRADWQVACQGKARFETRAAALAVARRRKRRKNRGMSNVYRCTGCGGYHLGGSK